MPSGGEVYKQHSWLEVKLKIIEKTNQFHNIDENVLDLKYRYDKICFTLNLLHYNLSSAGIRREQQKKTGITGVHMWNYLLSVDLGNLNKNKQEKLSLYIIYSKFKKDQHSSEWKHY